MKDFQYYKTWALNHLKKQLKNESAVEKSLKFCELILQKSFPVGTIREWKGKKYKKVAPGKWMRYYNSQSRGSSQALRYAIKQLEKIEDMETLAKFINANRGRFCDENGNPLPEAMEILKIGKEKASGLRTEKYQKLQEEFIEEIRTGKRSNTKELKEDIAFWKDLLDSNGYTEEHKNHIKEIIRIGEEELKKREKKSVKKEKKETPVKTDNVELSDFPEAFSKGKWKKQTKIFLDYLNKQDQADPLVKSIYKNLGKFFNSYLPFSIHKPMKKLGGLESFVVYVEPKPGIPLDQCKPVEQKLCMTSEFNDEKKASGLSATMLHELMHMADFSCRKNKDLEAFRCEGSSELLEKIQNAKITQEEMDFINELNEEIRSNKKQYITVMNRISDEIKELNRKIRNSEISFEKYEVEYDEKSDVYDDLKEKLKVYESSVKCDGQLSDIYDALCRGELFEKGFYGHGRKYYEKSGRRAREIVANVASLSILKPEHIERLEKYQPELMKEVYNVFKEMVKTGESK